MQTMEQQRAKHVWERINMAEKQLAGSTDKFLATVKALPATILMAGLGQAAAMLAAKGAKEVAQKIVYEALESWLCRQDERAPFEGGTGLLPSIMNCSRDEYLAAQREALLWLEWLKKLAVARLDQEGEG